MEIPKEVDVTITVQLNETNDIRVYANDQCIPNGWINLATHKLTIKIPPIDAKEILLKKVTFLEQSKQEIKQETFQKLKFIDEQIQSLLAIENKPDETDTKTRGSYEDEHLMPF